MKSQKKKKKTLTTGMDESHSIYKQEKEERASRVRREPQRRRGREQGSKGGSPGRSWRPEWPAGSTTTESAAHANSSRLLLPSTHGL